jgi:hypothetical protein
MHHAHLRRSLAIMLPTCFEPRLSLVAAPRRGVATSARGGSRRTWSPNVPQRFLLYSRRTLSLLSLQATSRGVNAVRMTSIPSIDASALRLAQPVTVERTGDHSATMIHWRQKHGCETAGVLQYPIPDGKVDIWNSTGPGAIHASFSLSG